MKKWIAAAAAVVGVAGLAGCNDDPAGRRPAAEDSCKKSVESRIKYPDFKDVVVDDHDDGTYTVTGRAGKWDDRAGRIRYYDFTCDARDDGSDVVGSARIDLTSGR